MRKCSKFVDILYFVQGGACFYCRTGLEHAPHSKTAPRGFTRDHVQPRSKGGKDGDNVILACARCNGLKADKEVPAEYQLRAQQCHRLARAIFVEWSEKQEWKRVPKKQRPFLIYQMIADAKQHAGCPS